MNSEQVICQRFSSRRLIRFDHDSYMLDASIGVHMAYITDQARLYIRQIRQIRLEIWPEPDLAGFPKNGRILDLPEPKSRTSQVANDHESRSANRVQSLLVSK